MSRPCRSALPTSVHVTSLLTAHPHPCFLVLGLSLVSEVQGRYSPLGSSPQQWVTAGEEVPHLSQPAGEMTLRDTWSPLAQRCPVGLRSNCPLCYLLENVPCPFPFTSHLMAWLPHQTFLHFSALESWSWDWPLRSPH